MTQAIKYWSISSIELCSEAEKLGLKVDIISKDKNLFYISSNTQKTLFKSTDFGGNSALGFKICADKGMTYDILGANDIPIAKSLYISKQDFSQSQDINIEHLSMPVIIKPLDGAHGDGVMMNITDINELLSKLTTSFEKYNNMIIQEQAEGDEVRVLVVKGEVVLARNRIPAGVVGDGILNIQQLIEKENIDNPLRGEGYESPLSHIIADDELVSYIGKQGLSLNSVPENNQKIQLRGNSNIGTGGTMINVTDIMHPSTKEICIRAAKLLGLEISGVDVLARDISKDLASQGGIILELNATPSLGGERELTGVNTAREILLKVFEL